LLDRASQIETTSIDALPYPPLEMRQLVGPTELAAFDNPEGKLVFHYVDLPPGPGIYERIFDFGCGCGRIARQLILQRPSPERYVGIDLHAGMIRWCQRNLQPRAPAFTFLHHDVFNPNFNREPRDRWTAPFPVGAAEFSLVIAHSVFTHLTEDQAVYYLGECARILDADGILYSSWFLFDKPDYPVMLERDNALYVSYIDPSATVLFDKQWLRQTAHAMGFRIWSLTAPAVRGHQWTVIMTRREGVQEPEFPVDEAPRGVIRPTVFEDRDPSKIGQEPELAEPSEAVPGASDSKRSSSSDDRRQP
jgi:SAM-dependent methyltransferase